MVVSGNLMFVSEYGARGDRESSAGYQSYWLIVFQFAGTNLWTGKIDKHCDRFLEFYCCGPCTFDVDSFLFMCAVRHVDAHAVRAGCDQLFHHFRLARRWPESD